MAITRDLWIILRARDEASRIIRSFGNNVSGAANSAAANMSDFDRKMQNVAHTLNQFAMTSMLAGAALAGVGVAGLTFIKSATDVATEYDRQVRHTLTQIDGISASLEQVGEIGRRVAREVEIPFEEMQETLFFIFSSMSVTLPQAEKLLKGFAQEAVAGQTTVEAAARSNIAILNALGLTVADLSRIQDVQFQVVRKGVITYEELSNTIGRVLPAAARSGQTFETVGAMMAFLTRNGLSAAMASASAARALESFAHPTVVKRLGEMGIKVKDVRGEFLPLIDVMTQMNAKLSKLAAPDRAKVLQELFLGAGGTIQARRFWDTAFKNFGDFEEMVGFMGDASGVFQNAYETMADSVAAKSVLLRNKWMLIQEALGRAVMPHLLQFMTLLGNVLDWFDRLPEPTKQLIAQFILWGSVISIVIGVLVILVGSLAFFVSGIMLAGTALVGILAAITALIVGFGALTAAVYFAWQRSDTFRKILGEIKQALNDVWQEIVQVATSAKESFDSKLRPSLERLWNVIDTRVIPALSRFVQLWREEIFPKLQAAGTEISKFVKGSLEYIGSIIDGIVIPAIQRLANWWEQNSDTLRPFLSVIGEVVKWLLIIGAVILALPILGFVTFIAVLISTIYVLIEGLKALWRFLVMAFNAVVDFFKNLVESIVGFVSGISQKVYNFLRPLTNLIREVFGLILDIIKFFTVLAIEVVKDWIIPFVGLITGGLQKLWQIITNIFMMIHNTIVGFFDRTGKEVSRLASPIFKPINDAAQVVLDFFRGFGSAIIDTFKGAGSWLLNAGKTIITGLINGITEKLGELRTKLKEITDLIPKIKGPKAVDLRLLLPAGKNIMLGFMKGIESQIPMLKSQLSGITGQFGQLPAPSFVVPAPSFVSGQSGGDRQITQYITINTQEINPRINAEELGFELGNRL